MNRYKHLLLLIGESPLPNAVVALAMTGLRTVHLIYSKSFTARIAGCLAAWLGRRVPSVTVHQWPVEDMTQPKDIVAAICRALSGIPRDEHLLLSYTGGTKAMAAHSHWAIHYELDHPDATRVGDTGYLDRNKGLHDWPEGGRASASAQTRYLTLKTLPLPHTAAELVRIHSSHADASASDAEKSLRERDQNSRRY